jgi:hypothetical protein
MAPRSAVGKAGPVGRSLRFYQNRSPLAINDNVNMDNATPDGRIFGGNTSNFSLVSGCLVVQPTGGIRLRAGQRRDDPHRRRDGLRIRANRAASTA